MKGNAVLDMYGLGDKVTNHTRFTAYHADTVEIARAMPDESVDYSIFSPPFAELYTYSNSERDIGNVRDYDTFFEHYRFLVREQFRVMAPGRLLTFHCMPYPLTKQKYDVIGIIDFRGDLLRCYTRCQLETDCGHGTLAKPCPHAFIYHSEVCIRKDPVTQMQRTKSIGLLHKQVKKDSAMSRQALADYMVTVRKPGLNSKPITHEPLKGQSILDREPQIDTDIPVGRWQQYAEPIWTDIDPSDTLNGYRDAREEEDEKHICPLQLEPIRRCVRLWSRPDDIVWSPFMGIGSEGYVALQMGRRFIGAELKKSYYDQAVKNLTEAASVKQEKLFGLEAT